MQTDLLPSDNDSSKSHFSSQTVIKLFFVSFFKIEDRDSAVISSLQPPANEQENDAGAVGDPSDLVIIRSTLLYEL